MNRLPASFLAGAALALLLTGPAAAGVVISMEATSPAGAEPEAMTLSLEADRMRMDSARGAFIFRADRNLAWVLKPAERSYMEMTEQQAEQLGGMMGQVQAQLAALPPEQRAMVEKMMAGKGGGMGLPTQPAAPTVATTYVATSRTQTINGWECASWDALRGGERTAELWVTPFADLGVKESDFAVCESMAEFVKKLSGPMARQFEEQAFGRSFAAGKDGPPGVPVRTVKMTGKTAHVTEIKKIERMNVPAATFEVPDGWTRQSMGP